MTTLAIMSRTHIFTVVALSLLFTPAASTGSSTSSSQTPSLLPLRLSLRLRASTSPSQPLVKPVSRGATVRGVVAFTNVNVITMSSDSVTRDVTVLIRDGRVAAMGRALNIPAGARRIDGRGRYLMPGLSDMHTHLFSDESLPAAAGPAELGVMLANGITTARLMIGTPAHLTLRDRVSRGEIVGPKLWVASAQFAGRKFPNTHVITSPAQAPALVRAVADSGFDFVKLTIGLTADVVEAVTSAAKSTGIPVVGHVETAVGVPRALELKQQIEHLDSYLEAVLRDDAPMRNALTQGLVFTPANWASMDFIDDRKIQAIAGATARAGIWSSPTLNVFNQAFAGHESDEVIRARPDFEMMPLEVKRLYLRARERYWTPAAAEQRTDARRARYIDVRNKLVKAIHDSGGGILAGSDTPEWFHVYGWGLHRELQAYVQAGLTPFQALRTATVNPAAYLGQEREWGRVATGQRADLMLLEKNPLVDIAHTQTIRGVMMGGQWFDRAALDSLLVRGRQATNPANATAPTTARTPAAVTQSLLNADRQFAANGNGLDALSALAPMFADGAIMPLSTGTMAIGKTAVLSALRASPDLLTSRISWSPIRAGISSDGQHGFTFGYMTQTKSDSTRVPLKYMAYWVREGGAWRVAAYKRARSSSAPTDTAMMPAAMPARIGAIAATDALVTRLRHELMRAEQSFSDDAQKRGLGNAFATFGLPDAVNMGGAASPHFVVGASQIATLVSGGDMTSSPVTWGADTAIVAASGDLGVTFGLIRPKAPATGASTATGSAFFTIWRRVAPNAPWRYIAE